jgi:hypothetical protein
LARCAFWRTHHSMASQISPPRLLACGRPTSAPATSYFSNCWTTRHAAAKRNHTPTLRRIILRDRWRRSSLPSFRRRFAGLTCSSRSRFQAFVGASAACEGTIRRPSRKSPTRLEPRSGQGRQRARAKRTAEPWRGRGEPQDWQDDLSQSEDRKQCGVRRELPSCMTARPIQSSNLALTPGTGLGVYSHRADWRRRHGAGLSRH